MLSILKWMAVPGSISCLAVCSTIGLVLVSVSPRFRSFGRLWLAGVYVLYLVLGLPVTSNAIVGRLPQLPPLANDDEQTADTLFVLGGDNARGRVAQTLRIYQAEAPEAIFLSARQWELEELLAAGVPRARIHLDETARNTRDQIDQLRAFRRDAPDSRIVVVASRLQMPRVSALVRRAGLDVTLAPSPIDDEPPVSGVRKYVPSYIALRTSRDALYEHAALAFHKYQGWIDREPRLGPSGDGARLIYPREAAGPVLPNPPRSVSR
jgi:uncharacterized SAM-binding protein YcdF (DUF218 family)